MLIKTLQFQWYSKYKPAFVPFLITADCRSRQIPAKLYSENTNYMNNRVSCSSMTADYTLHVVINTSFESSVCVCVCVCVVAKLVWQIMWRWFWLGYDWWQPCVHELVGEGKWTWVVCQARNTRTHTYRIHKDTHMYIQFMHTVPGNALIRTCKPI